MQSRTDAFIVCSPRSRVGVTTTARLLADYFAHRRRAFVGFDTDPHESPFADRFPNEARVADIASVKGQISLFDRLLAHDETPKVVDVWARSWKTFLSTIREIGFIEEARRLGVDPIVLLVVDGSPDCLDAANALRAHWPDLTMIVTRNAGAAPAADDREDVLALYPMMRSFEIPALDPLVARALDRRDLSLSRFLLAPPSDMSIVIRVALRTWLARVFAQFQSFELRRTMEGTDFLS